MLIQNITYLLQTNCPMVDSLGRAVLLADGVAVDISTTLDDKLDDMLPEWKTIK